MGTSLAFSGPGGLALLAGGAPWPDILAKSFMRCVAWHWS
jgi:hypothetical protein